MRSFHSSLAADEERPPPFVGFEQRDKQPKPKAKPKPKPEPKAKPRRRHVHVEEEEASKPAAPAPSRPEPVPLQPSAGLRPKVDHASRKRASQQLTKLSSFGALLSGAVGFEFEGTYRAYSVTMERGPRLILTLTDDKQLLATDASPSLISTLVGPLDLVQTLLSEPSRRVEVEERVQLIREYLVNYVSPFRIKVLQVPGPKFDAKKPSFEATQVCGDELLAGLPVVYSSGEPGFLPPLQSNAPKPEPKAKPKMSASAAPFVPGKAKKRRSKKKSRRKKSSS